MIAELQVTLRAARELSQTQPRELLKAVVAMDASTPDEKHREKLVRATRGKYKDIQSSSEDFMRRKAEEIDLESTR